MWLKPQLKDFKQIIYYFAWIVFIPFTFLTVRMSKVLLIFLNNLWAEVLPVYSIIHQVVVRLKTQKKCLLK